MQAITPADRPYALLGQMEQGTSLQGLPGNGVTSDNQSVMQELTTAYITTMYYSALSNLYLQGALPDDIAEVDAQMPRLKIAVERSYTDFMVAANWLAENGGEFIDISTAKQYYNEVLGLDDGSIKDISAVYSRKAK